MRSGRYRVREHGSWTDRISHSDLTVAVVDESERPAHHRIHLAVAHQRAGTGVRARERSTIAAQGESDSNFRSRLSDFLWDH